MSERRRRRDGLLNLAAAALILGGALVAAAWVEPACARPAAPAGGDRPICAACALAAAGPAADRQP